MDRNGLFALLLMAAAGLLLAIDWLFLLGAVLAIILYMASRPAGASRQGPLKSILVPPAPPVPPQQPIVIQASGTSLAHQLYMDLASNVVKDSMGKTNFHGIEHKIDHLESAISGKVAALEHKLEHAAASHGSGGGGGGHGH